MSNQDADFPKGALHKSPQKDQTEETRKKKRVKEDLRWAEGY